jgi:hypothetical protein
MTPQWFLHMEKIVCLSMQLEMIMFGLRADRE